MIDNRFIETANEIRKEFLRLQNELDSKQEIIDGFKPFIQEKIDEINQIKDVKLKTVQTKEEIIQISNDLHKTLLEIEDKEKSISKSIKEIDDKMKKLEKEEMKLLESIKKNYPNLTLQQIKEEIHSKID